MSVIAVYNQAFDIWSEQVEGKQGPCIQAAPVFLTADL